MREKEVETEKYVFSVWSERDYFIRVTVRLARNERHRRGNDVVTIEEIATQLKNIEKWEALKQTKRLIFEILKE